MNQVESADFLIKRFIINALKNHERLKIQNLLDTFTRDIIAVMRESYFVKGVNRDNTLPTFLSLETEVTKLQTLVKILMERRLKLNLDEERIIDVELLFEEENKLLTYIFKKFYNN